MSIFTFKAEGLTLPAVVSVVATEETAARSLALVWCNENSVDPGSLVLTSVEEFKTPCVVYGWNGDY